MARLDRMLSTIKKGELVDELKSNFKIAYDGCHKCYLIEEHLDEVQAEQMGYKILSFENEKDFKKWFDVETCELRFLHNWKLDKTLIAQKG